MTSQHADLQDDGAKLKNEKVRGEEPLVSTSGRGGSCPGPELSAMTSKAATRFLGSVPVKGARKRQSEEAAAGAPNDLELNCGDDDPMAGEETLLRMVAEEQEQQCHEPKSPADECVETSFVPGSQSVCEKSPRHSPSTQKQLLRGRRRSKKVNVFHSSADSTNVNDPRRLELSYWGLPELLLMRYRTRGVLTMFEWQAECLGVGSVLEGKSFASH